MIARGYGSGSAAGAVARNYLVAFEKAKRGIKIIFERGGDEYGAEDLCEWFRGKLDEAMNLKAGLRADGAPRKARCHCKHCEGRCDCALRRVIIDGRGRCGYGCRAPWGRKWEREWQIGAERDQRAIADKHERRYAIYQFNTPELRGRFAHLLSDRDFS